MGSVIDYFLSTLGVATLVRISSAKLAILCGNLEPLNANISEGNVAGMCLDADIAGQRILAFWESAKL